ncbi:MAG TPA: histidine phosphatase family protein [Steroidobacteraceae bacterium]|jgi:phosphohistidine phosphatase|nr:histidine phosphatase family protein [Steroidobacteraceae bacterium]
MGLEVILVRHAIAFDRDRARWPDDRDRPLSPKGKRKFRKAMPGLARWLPKIDTLLTSPLVRTRQTADILTDEAGWPEGIDTPELAPSGSPEAVLTLLRGRTEKRVALVGHEPRLGELLALCVAGPGARAFAPLKKGSVACVEFEGEVAAGQGTLTAFVPPRVLRKMD